MRKPKRQQSPRLTSTGHAYFAALFDVAGAAEIRLGDKGKFRALRLFVRDVDTPYLTLLRSTYGGVSRPGDKEWCIEGTEAEAFARAIRHFVPHKGRALDAFLRARHEVTTRKKVVTAKGFRVLPLTAKQLRRRAEIVTEANRPDEFVMPRSFTKT
jgi:hypothetical protein